MSFPSVLCIGGSDPSGGAGIQADCKACSLAGVHGVSVVTAVTAQNSKKVFHSYAVSADVVFEQLHAVFDEFNVMVAKTGLLMNEAVCQVVAEQLVEHGLRPIVDPVAVASSGGGLANSSYQKGLLTYILPSSMMIVANIREAERLGCCSINTIADMKDACKKLYSFGSEYVVIKGGHLAYEQAVDIVFDGTNYHLFELPRYPIISVHGSGCAFGSLIASEIAKGENPIEAVKKAKMLLWSLFAHTYVPDDGSAFYNFHPPHPLLNNSFTAEKNSTLTSLFLACKEIVRILPVDLVPEVGINFCYALPNAESFDEVCSINGRIIKSAGSVCCCGGLSFGGSKHIATVVLTAKKNRPFIRSVINLKYSKEIIDYCNKIGLISVAFSREDEPQNVESSMEWGTHSVLQQTSETPDIIYDLGAVGKEPMIRVLGTSPSDVLQKVTRIIQRYGN